MIELQRGGNAAIGAGPVTVAISWSAPAGLEVDCTAYLLASGGKVRGDHDMVFYNQPAGGDGAVSLTASAGCADFSVDPARLPAAIERIVFCLTVDGGQTFGALSDAAIGLTGGTGSPMRFTPPTTGATEAAMILGELYRRGDDWKFRAVGQGFNGGLAPLARSFGIEVDDDPAPAPAAAPAPPAANLVKPPPVILTKPDQRQKVALAKDGGGKLVVRATWVDNGDDCDDNDDLDLRVGLLLPDGRHEMIWAPDSPGAYDVHPFVRHLGDVTQASARAPATETVEVNPAIARHCGGPVGLVFSVYSAVSNGVVSVSSLKPRMRMEYGDQVVECAFDFLSKKLEDEDFIYTYVLGTALISEDGIELQPSGLTSEFASEETPRLRWDADGKLLVTVDGEPVFK